MDFGFAYAMWAFLLLNYLRPPKGDRGYVFTPGCLCLSVCLCARYLKELWMDSDEIWWAGWVCDKDELIRFLVKVRIREFFK